MENHSFYYHFDSSILSNNRPKMVQNIGMIKINFTLAEKQQEDFFCVFADIMKTFLGKKCHHKKNFLQNIIF